MKIILMVAAICTATFLTHTHQLAAQNAGALSSTASPAAVSGRALVIKVARIGKPNTRAVVVRRPQGGRIQDIIVVDNSTTAADLAKAVATLMYSRRSLGNKLPGEIRADVAPAARRTTRITPDERLASRDLARLRNARVVTLPGIGSGRAIPVAPSTVLSKTR
jgi:hypothetical protein